MEATAGSVASPSGDQPTSRFGVGSGQVIQEFGYDDDVDEELRAELEKAAGQELVDEYYDDVTDAAILWWREDDGDVQDLTDVMVDAQEMLEDGGLIWVFTPKSGRDGHVRPADFEEAASTAGLHATSAISAAQHWSGIRLTARGRGK
ncbi:DUF3052 domain-containing protein [Occultella aeris]|uniref:DUF3052 domain-containing protein n=1 Tax=Occultella aeris TaxID=2761496 RepID=A0A7M4DPY4_9MICO|nr:MULTISPECIES: DUF3052 domain-containing protein [Occultella]VZO39528.1 hypothetical protein HALOF300_04221 [Occultella aeris]